MNNDERQLVQVHMIKKDPSTAPYTKVYVYRNSVYGCVDPSLMVL